MTPKYISPVAIDLGAKYTGVFFAHYPSGTDPAEGARSGYLITAPDGGKQWSQRDRTANRHQRRGYKRAKLAKRLLHAILKEVFKLDLEHPMGPNQAAAGWFNSLLNNRGYTYLSEEINEELLGQPGPTIVHLRWPVVVPERQTLSERLRDLSGNLAMAARLYNEMASPKEFFKQPAVAAFLDEHFPEKEGRNRQKEIYAETRDALDRLLKAVQEGHHRRQDYLDNIRADIKNHLQLPTLLDGTTLTADSLANLVGHVSNVQLRPLRRYFNDKTMSTKDRWDEMRMAKFFWNYVEGWHAQEDNERNCRKALLACRNESLLKVWLETDPKLSVSPFEDQDNRRPPRCQSLLLDPAWLDAALPNWKTITRKLLTANPGLDESLENKPDAQGWPLKVPKGHPWRGEDNHLARILQRTLDRSRERDPYSLRLLVNLRGSGVSPSQRVQDGHAALERHLGGQHVEAFLNLAARYYAEAREARDGSWDAEEANGLLQRCDLHPPRKSKQRERLIGAILGQEISDAAPLHDFLRSEKIGRSTLIGIARRAAEAQKEYGNALKEIHQRNRWLSQNGMKVEDKEVLKLFDDCRATADRIGQLLKQDAKGWENYASPFSLAQLYNILETDIHGFSNTCQGCACENAWRSRVNAEGVANASRLPADSVRPFDGVLRRLLDAQADEIAERKSRQLRETGKTGSAHVPILIEENRFQFAEGLAEIKKSAKKKRDLLHKLGEEQEQRWLGKNERIKAASDGICAYTGKPLGKDGQLDHIVPQSETKKWQGTAYNSEANLIYVSTRGNTDKGKQSYNLDDLKPNYVKKQFGTSDNKAIVERIEKTMQPYFEGHKTYTSFLDLGPEEQLCLRHALFVPELRAKAIAILAKQTQARVNGTQKWFARRIIQHLKHRLRKQSASGAGVTFSIHRVSAEDVHHVREVLASANPVYRKTAPQPAASHVLDAALTFACGLQNPRLADILTWPLDDDPEQRTEWLGSLVPPSLAIYSLERKTKYRKPNPAGQKLFKDGIYGERFVPLLIDKQGRLAVGFEPKNCLGIEEGEELWFDLLRPFMCFQNKPLEGAFSVWQQRARDSGKSHLYFTVDKPAAFEHLYKVAKQLTDERALQQADLLDGLRYVVHKQDLSEALVTPDRKQFKKRNEVLKDKSFEISVAFAGGYLPRDMDKPKDKLMLPARRDWERLLAAPAIQKRLGKEAKDFDWRGELEKIFPSDESDRQHGAVRKVYSLPVVAVASGGFRARRYTPDKKPVWQLMSVEGYAAQGFELGDNGKLGEPATLPLLQHSPSLVAANSRYRAHPTVICRFDEWRDIAVDRKQYPWLLRLEYAPGTQDRFYVRATLPFAEFRKRVLPHTRQSKGVSVPQELSADIKVEKPKEYREKLGELLAQPRSHLFLTAIGDNVTFWYIVESTSAAMRKRYEEAISKRKG